MKKPCWNCNFFLQTDKTGIKAKLSEALKSIGNVKSSSKIEASEENSEDEEDSGHESNSNDDDQDPMDNNWKTDLAQKASEAFYQRLVFEHVDYYWILKFRFDFT